MAVNALLSCLVVGLQPKPILLQPRVTDASVFKDGLCYLVREVDLKPGKNLYRIEKLPDAYDGTLWYQAPAGTAVSSLRTKLILSSKPKMAPARTRLEFLIANVGKTLKMTLASGKGIEGKILAVIPQEQSVTVALANGSTKFLPLSQISEIDTRGGATSVKVEERSASLGLEFEAVTSSPSKMQFITLERGAAWASSYWLRLEDKKAAIEGKAQLALGSLGLNNANVQVLSGQPDIGATTRYDLAVGYGSLNSYLTNTQSRYEDFRSGAEDPYTLLPMFMNKPRPPLGTFARSSDPGFVPQSIDFISYDPTDNSIVAPRDNPITEADRPASSGAQRVESIYAYNFGRVTMDRGDRLTRTLFQQESDLESLVKWEAIWGDSDVVTSIVRLTNSAKEPWTTGPVFISKDNVPLAQVQMPFTPPGKFADLRLGKVQDVLVRRAEKEVGRTDYSDPKNPKADLSMVTSEFTYTVENTRNDEATLELFTTLPGEILEAGGTTVERLPIYQSIYNRFNSLRWRITLKPGEKRELLIKAKRVD